MIPQTPALLKIELLKAAVESLSIPLGMYEKAVERYEAVTAFLEAPGTRVASWRPYQCIQGSAALGLAIRPMARDNFDFDISCELTPPDYLTSLEVRNAVEVRLREDGNYSRMLNTEKLRCLRLDYAEAEKFHLDIVVAKVARWQNRTGTAVQVPDKKLEQWIGSDPRGYINWFKSRQIVTQFERSLLALSASALQAETAPAPRQPKPNEKLPIQWAIQIMKRHRDVMFQGERSKDAPISAIITTLAAKAYQGQGTILEALLSCATRMIDQFDDQAQTLVLNPVLPTENFADKWPHKPARRKAFFEWHAKLMLDVRRLIDAEKLLTIGDTVENLLGEKPKAAAFATHAELLRKMQASGTLGTAASVATLASTLSGARAMPAHTNFGGVVK